MLSFLRTLRFKLVLLYLAVFGVIQVGLAALVLDTCERVLRSNLDQRLASSARSMLEVIDVTSGEAENEKVPMDMTELLDPFAFVDCYFQILDDDGQVIERSHNLRGTNLPRGRGATESLHNEELVLETIRGKDAEVLVGRGHELRMATVHKTEPTPFRLQVGLSLASIEQALLALRRAFLTLVPVGLLAAGGSAWLLARRSLAPIGAIARRAHELTAERLSQRIPVPGGRDEVTDMVFTINEMLDRLESAFRAHERFIADAAHELKTPVTLLLGQAQVLAQKTRSPEEYDQFVESLQGELRHLAQIVESLLTLARADAGFPLSYSATAFINDVVMEAVQRSQPQASQAGVRLHPTLALPSSDRVDLCVAGDAELLRTLLINLIRNAVRHSPREGVVEVEAATESGEVRIAVRDRGPGIPQEERALIFERFYRIVGRDGEATEGMGLGLAIAKAVAKLHKGSIYVSSREGGGSQFLVRLPLAPVDDLAGR